MCSVLCVCEFPAFPSLVPLLLIWYMHNTAHKEKRNILSKYSQIERRRGSIASHISTTNKTSFNWIEFSLWVPLLCFYQEKKVVHRKAIIVVTFTDNKILYKNIIIITWYNIHFLSFYTITSLFRFVDIIIPGI